MTYKKMIVTLKGTLTGKTRDLEYEIRQHPVAQLWAHAVFQSQSAGLRETDRLSNFSSDTDAELDVHLARLTRCLGQLKEMHPELNLSDIDGENLSQSINHLHYHFAHSNLVTSLVDESNRKTWEEFNVLLHAVESSLHSRGALERHGLPDARIVFTWNENHPVPIPDEMYKEFTLQLMSGYAYANYSQVGRQLFEMFLAKDETLADEHIQPSRFISGDTFLWFGYTLGHQRVIQLEGQLKSWFEGQQERFNKLGFNWGDPKLSLGMIPVARLTSLCYQTYEIKELIKELCEYDKVSSVTIS